VAAAKQADLFALDRELPANELVALSADRLELWRPDLNPSQLAVSEIGQVSVPACRAGVRRCIRQRVNADGSAMAQLAVRQRRLRAYNERQRDRQDKEQSP
jgi:hypothetical protein